MTEKGRQLLEEKIKASGLKKEYLLQQMHLKSMTSFSNKLSGTTEFTAGEIAALADSLRLSREEVHDIFLADRVASESPSDGNNED